LDQPVIIGVGGFTSNVGKTTLMCELLRAFPGWEAIKTTRGHYRSCGKDPHACCVSHLLSEEPLVRSGREATYDAGKDTGRYWDAGASNVHWLIATDNQIEKGIKEALSRVRSHGVFIEGNSFSQFVQTDHFVMVRSGSDKIKSTAREALAKATSIYVSEIATAPGINIPTFTPSNLPALIDYLRTPKQRSEFKL
jgi:molybdopterin-guanine dinucleotide biosynthesis protein